MSPTQIERPTTPKKLTAVLSKFASEGDAEGAARFYAETFPNSSVSAVHRARKGAVRARDIREGLRRLQEHNLVDRYLQL
mgnify:CR=1 FL=1